MLAEPVLSLAVSVAAERDVQSVLNAIVRGLAAQPYVALVRIWLALAGDVCDSCFLRPSCPNQTECLHLMASAGNPSNSPGEDWTFLQGHFRRIPLNSSKVGEVGTTEIPILIKDFAPENDWIVRPDWARREGIRSFVGHPLVFQGKILGVLALFSRECLSEQDSTWLGIFAKQAAVAIANARAFEEIARLRRQLEFENAYLHENIEDRKRAEEELQRSAFYLAEGQRLAHSGSWSFAPSGICDYWSQELYQILGFDPAKGIPTIADCLTRVHPEDREFVEGTINQMVTEGIGCDVKKRIIRPDGELRVIRCVGTPARENGAVTRFIGTLMDITDQERMTQELQRKEAYLAEAQTLSHTGSFGWNLSSGEIFWSEETFRIFEYDRANCKPTVDLVLQRVHPKDIPLVQQAIDHASKGNDFDLEHRLLMTDGSVKHVHVVAHASRDESGNAECIGAVTDITERKQAEDGVRAARAQFEGILGIADDAIISVDSNQRILLFNQGAEKVFGYMQTDVVGRSLDLLLPQRRADLHRTHFDEFARSPDVARTMGQRREVYGRRKDGAEFPAEASISKLDLGGRLVFTVILRDITERKRAEQSLVAQHTVAQVLAESATLEEATPKVLRAVCECLVWDVGELWRIDRAAGVLRCVEVWHKEFIEAPQFTATRHDSTFMPGIGLPGRVWSSRKPAYIPDVVQDSNFPRAPIAARAGLHAAFAFPILLGSQVVGVMDFFSHEIRQPDQDLIDMMATIGSQIGQFIERKRAEQRIQQDERELRQLIDFVPQHILVTRPDGTRLYASQGTLEYHGMTLPEVQAENFFARVLHPDDYRNVLDRRQVAISTGTSWEAEARLLRKDGQYRWFLMRSKLLRDEQGSIIKRCVTATDIDDRQQAEERVHRENAALREEIDKASMFEEIVGSSEALRRVLSEIAKVAPTDSTVLITGETGTGKELIARALHKRSRRSSRAFVSVNCAAIPESLIASELFGHEKGAFTGALQRRLGRFELAEGGTIFLDEIGDLPADTQNTLLHVLQEHEFERVGGTETIRANVRVIAATNSDLKIAMAKGDFRSDLFYRLNVFPIEVPPLRERKEDIPMLVEYFIGRYASKVGKKINTINKKSLELLRSYYWPGNIRELQNVIERAIIVCESEALLIDENWLSLNTLKTPPLSKPLSEELLARQRETIEAALAETRGRVSGPFGAAAKLGIPRSTLDSKIRSLKINTHRFRTF